MTEETNRPTMRVTEEMVLTAILAEIDFHRKIYPEYSLWDDYEEDEKEEVIAGKKIALQAALAHFAVGVKPLEWRGIAADCACGEYAVFFDEYVENIDAAFWSLNDGDQQGPFDDIEEARAAAQADYVRRIRSALVEQPVEPTPERKYVEEITARSEDYYKQWLDNTSTKEAVPLTPPLQEEKATQQEPTYWAVKTGVRIGLWSDKARADEALRKYEDSKMISLYATPQPDAQALREERIKIHEQVIRDIDHAHKHWKGPVLMKLRRQYAVSLATLQQIKEGGE